MGVAPAKQTPEWTEPFAHKKPDSFGWNLSSSIGWWMNVSIANCGKNFNFFRLPTKKKLCAEMQLNFPAMPSNFQLVFLQKFAPKRCDWSTRFWKSLGTFREEHSFNEIERKSNSIVQPNGRCRERIMNFVCDSFLANSKELSVFFVVHWHQHHLGTGLRNIVNSILKSKALTLIDSDVRFDGDEHEFLSFVLSNLLRRCVATVTVVDGCWSDSDRTREHCSIVQGVMTKRFVHFREENGETLYRSRHKFRWFRHSRENNAMRSTIKS